jgi:hypothetical protein
VVSHPCARKNRQDGHGSGLDVQKIGPENKIEEKQVEKGE